MDNVIVDYLLSEGIPQDLIDKRLPIFETIEIVPGAYILREGTEIHHVFSPNMRRKVVSRKAYRTVIERLLEEHGMITTRTPKDKPEIAGFAERIGFIKTWNDDKWVYFVLENMPFERKEKCQQPPQSLE